MQRRCAIIFLSGMLFLSRLVCGQEMRATWLARDSLGSKAALALAMDTVASNHFNVVFVNAWSRGYPLWKSQVFSNETGLAVDPNFVGRDILAEAVAEGHRNGLHVYAWFEYGFVGGYTGYLPGSGGKGKIFDAHPDWVATKNSGGQLDSSGFYWMTQTRSDVQQFLILLASEVAANYDLDGIEFDRIRYSSLEYGYDSFTKTLYQSEHGGASPPTQTNDPSWIRWRADKLNEFVANAYDAIKLVHPQFKVANAPSAYSSSSYTAYNSFCQDWVWWVNNAKVDHVELQSYFSTSSSFGNVLAYVAQQTSHREKIFPSFAINPNSVYISSSEILKFPAVTKSQGFSGNAIWYFVPLNTSNYFGNFKTNIYQTKVSPPQYSMDWRDYRALTSVSDATNAPRTGSWIVSSIAGFSGPSFFASTGALATIDYFADVPVAGKYEVYAFTVTASNRSPSAEYLVYDSAGNVSTQTVNQTLSGNAGWYKLGDFLLAPGHQWIAQVTNRGLTGGQLVSADALMILLNRRLSTPVRISLPPFNLSNGSVPIRIAGAAGQKLNIETSQNLKEWIPVGPVLLTNSIADYLLWPNSDSTLFYRAALAP